LLVRKKEDLRHCVAETQSAAIYSGQKGKFKQKEKEKKGSHCWAQENVHSSRA